MMEFDEAIEIMKRDDSIDLKNYYERARDIAENVLKGDKNDETNI